MSTEPEPPTERELPTAPKPSRDQRSDQPIGLSRGPVGEIVIEFDGGRRVRWMPSQLRAACPCATCREKKRSDLDESEDLAEGSKAQPNLGLPVLSAAEAQPIRVVGMQPVGNYAYQIDFTDGHRSGLFPLELLAAGPRA